MPGTGITSVAAALVLMAAGFFFLFQSGFLLREEEGGAAPAAATVDSSTAAATAWSFAASVSIRASALAARSAMEEVSSSPNMDCIVGVKRNRNM
jgi:hypothetical protein